MIDWTVAGRVVVDLDDPGAGGAGAGARAAATRRDRSSPSTWMSKAA